MPTQAIESIGIAIMAGWLLFAIVQYRKAIHDRLPKRQAMTLAYRAIRYMYVSLMALGIIALVWQWLAPTRNALGGR